MLIQYTFIDYPHPEKDAVIYYMSGCEHNCKGCQSPELQQFKKNKNSISFIIELIDKSLKSHNTNNLVISGGDCLHPLNVENTKNICDWFKTKKNTEICLYSGYDFDYILKLKIKNFDFIKGGKYVEELKQISKKTENFMQFASKNQFLIDSNGVVVSKNGKYDFKKEENNVY